MGIVRELLRPAYLKWLYFRLWPERQPAGFRDCWHFPEAADTKADFVFLPMTDWHGPVQRTQQLALALAARGRSCVYLNPHLGREFRQPYPFGPGTAAREVARGIVEVHVHLPREPVFHHRPLVAHEEERVARALARVLRPEGVVVSCFPLWNGVTERLREACGAVVVYDCHDWLAGFGNVATELLAAERKAMDGADLTLFSSQTLAERWGAREPLILHNAGDPGHFGLIPWRRRERPVIGYAGALNHWFDVPAVTRAAELRPDWDFLLIGPVDAVNVNPLRKLPNVSLTGPVPYAELPQRLAGCDLALIPFKLTPLIEAVNPVKLYEYLACGLPVVSSRLPEVAALGDHVYTYAAADQMPEAIEKGLLEDSPGRREARRARVLGETWAARAEALETGVARIRTQRKP